MKKASKRVLNLLSEGKETGSPEEKEISKIVQTIKTEKWKMADISRRFCVSSNVNLILLLIFLFPLFQEANYPPFKNFIISCSGVCQKDTHEYNWNNCFGKIKIQFKSASYLQRNISTPHTAGNYDTFGILFTFDTFDIFLVLLKLWTLLTLNSFDWCLPKIQTIHCPKELQEMLV